MTAELDLLAAAAWPALEQVEVGGWLLRASAGVTQRANSALPLVPLADAGPLEDLLGAVEDFYDARLLPPRVQVSEPALDEALATRGWVLGSPADVLVGDLPDGPPGAEVAEEPDEAWLRCWWAVDGRGGEAELDVARRMLDAVRDPVGYARVVRDGQVVAVGRAVAQGPWLGVFALGVRPEHRRHGLARTVLAALRDWGAAHGTTSAYLQVAHANAPARQLYAGMRTASSYGYRTRG